MRNNLSRLAAFNVFPAFDAAPLEGGGGGGAAVAAPPPAAPASGAGGASGGGAPSGGAAPGTPGGIFAGIHAPAPTVPPAGAPAAKPGETPAPPPAGWDGSFGDKPLYGRFKTRDEAEDGFRRSEAEGVRLSSELKTIKSATEKAKAEYEAKVKQLAAELEVARTTTPFKELSVEALTELRKNDPAAYADYKFAKDAHDREVAARKASVEQQERDRASHAEATLRTIRERDEAMRADPKTYPRYVEMLPVMDQFVELTKVNGHSPLTGHPWSGETLYYMALGLATARAGAAGVSEQDKAAAAAKAAAGGAAAAAASPAGGGGAGAAAQKTDAQKEQEDWEKRTIAAAPKPFFSGT
jgi:hypothetical protein